MALTLRKKFKNQRSGATWRGISFELTFEEWLNIWVDSGHLHERGPRKGQYVMARFGDKGPYAIGNVRIITVEENNAEKIWVPTLETRAKWHDARIGNKNCVGRKFSTETLSKLGTSQAAAWGRRKQNGTAVMPRDARGRYVNSGD